jgi:hypothetical protein
MEYTRTDSRREMEQTRVHTRTTHIMKRNRCIYAHEQPFNHPVTPKPTATRTQDMRTIWTAHEHWDGTHTHAMKHAHGFMETGAHHTRTPGNEKNISFQRKRLAEESSSTRDGKRHQNHTFTRKSSKSYLHSNEWRYYFEDFFTHG